MMTLGELTGSEFSLLGAVGDEELMMALEGASPQAKRNFGRAIRQFARSRNTGPSKGSRGELEKRLHMLPRDMQEGLARKTLQAVDAAYYVVKDISGSRVQKLFKDDDNKVVGLSNISSAKLEKGNFFMLSDITLLSGVAGDNESAQDVNFRVIPDYILKTEELLVGRHRLIGGQQTHVVVFIKNLHAAHLQAEGRPVDGSGFRHGHEDALDAAVGLIRFTGKSYGRSCLGHSNTDHLKLVVLHGLLCFDYGGSAKDRLDE